MYKTNEVFDGLFKQHKKSKAQIEQTTPEYPSSNQFKLSSNVPTVPQNTTQQLLKMQSVIKLRMANKLSAVFDILQIKVLSRVDVGFLRIRQAQDCQVVAYGHLKVIQSIMAGFTMKLRNVSQSFKRNQSQYFISNLKELCSRTRNENSKRQMLRINSKLDRQHDQLQMLQKNTTQSQTYEKTNKMLRKKKENNEKEFASFKHQMEELLNAHQKYLNRKG